MWLGIGIRHWVHAVEYGALGLFVVLAAKSAMGQGTIAPGMAALAICAGLELRWESWTKTGQEGSRMYSTE